ncbi:nuclease-related domain-containing protein [Fervidibacillus halotolerans]|uniref:NERD domain-containing protein n=1 Tax=Fervidibacillus halotolerans TaxID=2980027 RepID=A0A9E8RWH5_9BACI|nr:nuclease-related domain-containing protein [Fervidibacillus halotolerans]WAA11760.1 NERD domain-containing protein [Fervidibacillus halotolerans]
MAQLIKLQDYISRYETGIYKYPPRFIRMKRKQWEQWKQSWEEQKEAYKNGKLDDFLWDDSQEKRGSFLNKLTGWFHRKNDLDLDEWFEENKSYQPVPQSIDQLKKQFLDDLFQVQILWASSTLTERSYVDSSFYREEQLKFLLQRLPDTFLLLYKPIFLLKKAPMEGDSIILTPTEVFLFIFLEEERDAVFAEGEGRFWMKRTQGKNSPFVNPMIQLNRMEAIIRSIFQHNSIDIPIKKIILSRNGYIDFPSAPFGVTLVDQRNFQVWLKKIQTFSSPLKHMQLKAAQSILQYCKTNSISRVDER